MAHQPLRFKPPLDLRAMREECPRDLALALALGDSDAPDLACQRLIEPYIENLPKLSLNQVASVTASRRHAVVDE